MNIQDKDQFGFYKVGDLKFYSKLQALEMQQHTNICPTWHFNESTFKSIDWSIEPKESLSELYKKRAQQIREKYDYIVLWYSGGADSHNVLMSFVKNNIFIDNKKLFPVNFDEFNFRVSYQVEENISMTSKNFILQNWDKNKKMFRFLNRVTFTHPDYPINVDISITKFNGDIYKKTYTVEESNVFNSPERIEIELEVDNNKIGPYTQFDTHEKILEAKVVTVCELSTIQKEQLVKALQERTQHQILLQYHFH
jgi:hypothetical protein